VPDLLTHVLVAYSGALVVSWRVTWIDRPFVTVAMMGAVLPDLAKANLLVPNLTIERLLSLPFSWTALHTTGGVTLTILMMLALVDRPYRRRVGLLLGAGALTHLSADALLRSVTNTSYPVFWPLTSYEPPTPGLYLSTDPWLALVAGGLAVAVTVMTRYRSAPAGR
jgi:hypothetical protein